MHARTRSRTYVRTHARFCTGLRRERLERRKHKCVQYNRAAVLSVRSMQRVCSRSHDVQHDPHREHSHATTNQNKCNAAMQPPA
eukprot:15455881-Alexandrium_andersonii.AAC.1